MRRSAFGRWSLWRRPRPTGPVPPLPPQRRAPAADAAPTEVRAGSGPVAPAPSVAPAPGPVWPTPVTAAPSSEGVAAPSSEGDGGASTTLRPGPRQSRIRVLHSASELDDARARAAAQLERIEAAMAPVVRRQQRASGGAP
jgi:hypothetical protein